MKPENIRCFLAIDLGAGLQTRLQALSDQLKMSGNLPVRWVAGKNIHLTIKFLGEESLERVKRLEKRLSGYIKQIQPFKIQSGGLGIFPASGNPRVIWVGISAPAILAELAGEVEKNASAEGFEPENRKFSPHLTLGRVTNSASPQQLVNLRDLVKSTRVESLGTVGVDGVRFIQSVLTPSGPIYTTLAILPFSC